MKILITGAAGKLGSQLQALLQNEHEVADADIVGNVSHHLDIAAYRACRKLIADFVPDIVLHPAAWTDVNGCALNPDKALLVNGVGTGHLAAITGERGIPLLYVSTNEVFDGAQSRAFTEYDKPNPINAYGYSKWYGERAIAAVNPRHYIVRSSWLFAPGGGNFIHAILSAARAGKPLRVVTNEIANPTYNTDLAQAIVKLIESERYGTYHLVNEGAVSRWQLARFVLDQEGLADIAIEPISSHEWPRPSLPPEFTALSNHAGASIGIRLRPWQEAVRAFLDAEAVG